jgi:hypothetical protein
MIDRRRRPFDTRFFMTIAKRNVPSEWNGLKSGPIQSQLARTFPAKWIWRGAKESRA